MQSSLHLSLVRLSRADARWRHLDAYQAHQVVWHAFPDVPRGERPFLFHHDTRADAQSLLVQSTVVPDWTGLAGADVRTKRVDAGGAGEGARLSFSLRANPTVARQGFADGVTRRVAVGLSPERAFAQQGRAGEHPTSPADVAAWRDAELRRWLDGQAVRTGFEVERADAGPVIRRQVVRARGMAPMTLHEVEFSGVLLVTDATAFARARAEGVGRGRAFGFGLLMLRPA